MMSNVTKWSVFQNPVTYYFTFECNYIYVASYVYIIHMHLYNKLASYIYVRMYGIVIIASYVLMWWLLLLKSLQLASYKAMSLY